MNGLSIIARASFAALPWKNGGGITHEAIRRPPAGDPFSWRVSLAQIDRSGPFSDFTGYDRKMLLLRGGGIALEFGSGERRMLRKPGDWLQFDGGAPVHCELLDGPCVDLNLMVSNSLRSEARLERMDRSMQADAGQDQTTVIFSLEDPLAIETRGGEAARLEPWDLCLLSKGTVRLNRIGPHKPAAGAVFIATISQ